MAATTGPRAGSVSSSRAPSSRRTAVPDFFEDAPTVEVVPRSAGGKLSDDVQTDVMERLEMEPLVLEKAAPERPQSRSRKNANKQGDSSSAVRRKVADGASKVLARPPATPPSTPAAARFEKRPTEPLSPPVPAGQPARRADPSPVRDQRTLAGYAKSGAVAVPSFSQASPVPRRHKSVRKAPKKGFWRSVLGFFGIGSSDTRKVVSKPGNSRRRTR